MKRTLIYDVETYPNFFSAVFIDYDTDDVYTFYVYGSHNDIPDLIDFLNEDAGCRLVGHNSLEFDDPILRAILMYPQITTAQLYRLADMLIRVHKSERKDKIPHYYDLRYPNESLWEPIDTMEITRVNQIRAGLKHSGIVLHQPRLQDLPIPPGTKIKKADVSRLLKYNVNDVKQTKALYKQILPLIELREGIGELFGVDVTTANDTAIAKTVLDVLYPNRSNTTLAELKEFARNAPSTRKKIRIADVISPTIRFDTPIFNEFMGHLKRITLHEYNNFRLPKTVPAGMSLADTLRKFLIQDRTGIRTAGFEFDGIKYNFGIGGLHSDDPPAIYESDDDWLILEIDATSFYPYIMIANGFFPEHLTDMPRVFPLLVEERVHAKKAGKAGDKTQATLAQVLKIVINSIYGLMGNKYYWLYDPKALVSVTISGQLYLLDLVEKLHLAGIKTISANTDGVNVRVHRSQIEKMREVYHEVEERTGLTFEETHYDKIVARDVNNYIAVKASGSIKTKGVFQVNFEHNGMFYNAQHYFNRDSLTEKDATIPIVTKGYQHPIVSIAVLDYFLHDVLPETTIHNHDNIHEFVITTRINPKKFMPIFYGENGREVLQKTNRFIVATEGGSFVKEHIAGGRDSRVVAGKRVKIVNDITDTSASSYPVDYQWYIDEAYKIINQIKPPQKGLGLF